MAEEMKKEIAAILRGIDRYNPDNLLKLERYVEFQSTDNVYDLDANLAVLKLYQFNPGYFQTAITALILLKALTNLPHSDFVLCKYLIDGSHLNELLIKRVLELHELLETCRFKQFWAEMKKSQDVIAGTTGFEEAIRKYICHVIGITYQTIQKSVLKELLGDLPDSGLRQWVHKNGWREQEGGIIFVANQEELVKTKNIAENIDFDSVAHIMASCR